MHGMVINPASKALSDLRCSPHDSTMLTRPVTNSEKESGGLRPGIREVIETDRRAVPSDPVVHHLRPCLQTARSRPSEMCSGCLGHLETALQAYVQTHQVSLPVARGGLAPSTAPRNGHHGLIPRGKGANHRPGARVQPVAGTFCPCLQADDRPEPHRWLMERRIEKAKQLLTDTTLSLAEIAIACGFADQSHFTRAFSRTAHSSPGAWRRYLRNDPSRQRSPLRAA
jgi:helix-turn-helix protein